jgi:hypothetical protein
VKIFKLMVLVAIGLLLISCAEINKNVNIHQDYVGKIINKKTLLIQSVENDSIFLEHTGGLDNDVRKGEPRDLFNKLVQKDLPWRIKQNSTFRKVKYETVEDSSKYDFTLKLKNISVRLIETNEETGITKTGLMKPTRIIPNDSASAFTKTTTSNPFGNSLFDSEYAYVKLSFLGGFEIIDNHNKTIVLSGTITELGEKDYDSLDYGKTKTMKDSQYKMINKQLTKKLWIKAVEDLGVNLIEDTPFFKEQKDGKYYDFDKF